MCNKWTDVKSDNPPERNEWGSCWWLVNRKSKIPERALFIGEGWVQESGGFLYDVTHWMPLPALPDEAVEQAGGKETTGPKVTWVNSPHCGCVPPNPRVPGWCAECGKPVEKGKVNEKTTIGNNKELRRTKKSIFFSSDTRSPPR